MVAPFVEQEGAQPPPVVQMSVLQAQEDGQDSKEVTDS
jgi:hypothetical protein